MKILIIGAGMYVTGRDGSGVGTVLASLAELSKLHEISEVVVVATSLKNDLVVSECASRINGILGTHINVRYINIGGDASRDISKIVSRGDYACALISTPDHLHFSYAAILMSLGIPCLIVKPLTPTLAEGIELEKIRSENGVYAAVEFHKRWDVTNLWIRKAISEGMLGKLLYFTVDYSQKISIPMETFTKWADKTNIFQYLGVHYVDLIWFLTGFRPIRVVAVGSNGVLRSKGIQTWDAINASIIWQKPGDMNEQFVSQFAVSWVDPNCTSALSDQKYKLVGTKGRIECDQKNRGVELVHENLGIQQINPYFSEFLPDQKGATRFNGYGYDSIRQFIEDVLDIKSGKLACKELIHSRPTLKQALISTAVVDAVNRSLVNKFNWEEVDEIF